MNKGQKDGRKDEMKCTGGIYYVRIIQNRYGYRILCGGGSRRDRRCDQDLEEQEG